MSRAYSVEADGVALHVEESGQGPVLIFGHSLLCDGTMFEAQVRALSKQHRVLNLDFRGHGKSGPARRPFTIEDQAEDFRRALDVAGADRAVVVGLSMGGMAALHLALRHPQRVAGLVLLDTSGAAQEPWWSIPRFNALALAARWIGIGPFLLNQIEKQMFGATFRRTDRPVVEHWRAKFARLDRVAVGHAVRMVTGRPSVEARLGEIRVPALVLCGEEDVATPPHLARRLAGGLRDARLELVPEAGHLSTVERPALTTERIAGFLQQIGW